MKTLSLIVAASVAVAAAGCGYERRSETGPSASGASALSGNWTSSNIIPSPQSCSNFRWTASQQTATSARGSFSATCAGDLQVSGTAEGSFAPNSSVINWSANGTATAPGITNCPITLTGTAELGVDSIRIPYTGTTCLGSVSGVQTLRR